MSKRKLVRAIEEQEGLEALEAWQASANVANVERVIDPIQSTLDSFFADGLITEILHTVKSGKEATVYCCRAHPTQKVPYLAAKVYRSRDNRGFKNDSIYQEGRYVGDQRIKRAMKNKSDIGREAQFSLWVAHEFEMLQRLYQAGSAIPRPIARNSQAILMEYLGEQDAPAPALYTVTLTPNEVYPVFEVLMDNIQLWLQLNVIHGDLSPYNVLFWHGKPTVIDFPQAVDPRFNSHAYTLLARDIDNICKYVARYGLQRDSQQLTNRLWQQFKNARF
jgi:RIO kinase 1